MELQKSLRSSFCGQLKLSLQGGAVAKEGSSTHEALKRHKISSLLPANYSAQPPPIATISPTSKGGTTQAFKRCNGNSEERLGRDENLHGYKKPPIPRHAFNPYNTQV